MSAKKSIHLPDKSSSNPTCAIALMVGVTVFTIWAFSLRWHGSIQDAFESRQTQTALSTYYLKQDGLRFDYETPVLGPPWSIPMEFPLYQSVVAQLSTLFGLPLESAGRLTSILFFYLTLPGLWLLLQPWLADRSDRLLALIGVMLCPLYLFYSRTFLIETTALCLCTWFIVFLDRSLNKLSFTNVGLAWILGGLGAITKVTTFGAFGLAAAFVVVARASEERGRHDSWVPPLRRAAMRALLAASIPLLAGFAWVLYSDAVKQANPYGEVLSSSSLSAFNFGTWQQRLDPQWWRIIRDTTLERITAPATLIVVAAGIFFVPRRHRLIALALLASYPCGILLFANLYYVHEYYFCAAALFPTLASGVVMAGLSHHRRLPRFLTLAALTIVIYAQIGLYHRNFYRRIFGEPDLKPPAEAGIIRQLTPSDQPFAAFGFDWSSRLPYYAERRGILPFDSHTYDYDRLDRSLANLKSGTRVATVAVSRHYRSEYPFIAIIRSKLQLTAEPVVKTDQVDIYVRWDRVTEVADAITALASHPGIEIHLPDTMDRPLEGTHFLDPAEWSERLTMAAPTPAFSRGPYQIAVGNHDGSRIISTHAPTEIYFRPPPGSRSIFAVGGMLPAAYSGENVTPGVRLMVFEELADGTRRTIFERLLEPLTNPTDRGDVTIRYEQTDPFIGNLVFATLAVPSGDIRYAWSYWQSIHIQ